MESFNPIIFKSNLPFKIDLKTYKLLRRINILKKCIPFNIILQKSNTIKCQKNKNINKIFYPKIFLSRYDYYLHVYNQLKKVLLNYKMLKTKNTKIIIITHYKEILYR